MAILDVNTLGAVNRTPTGFLSNLVQRECLGGPTCMPIYFLFRFKMAHDNTVLDYISKIVQDSGISISYHYGISYHYLRIRSHM